MPVLTAPAAPTHDLGGARFTSLASPSRGASDTSVWKVEILPGTPATPHSLTREEVFVVLRGSGELEVDGERIPVDPDTIVRVGPKARRKFWPGEEGMRVLALGGVPGQPYEPPDVTKLGEPDPLAR